MTNGIVTALHSREDIMCMVSVQPLQECCAVQQCSLDVCLDMCNSTEISLNCLGKQPGQVLSIVLVMLDT